MMGNYRDDILSLRGLRRSRNFDCIFCLSLFRSLCFLASVYRSVRYPIREAGRRGEKIRKSRVKAGGKAMQSRIYTYSRTIDILCSNLLSGFVVAQCASS